MYLIYVGLCKVYLVYYVVERFGIGLGFQKIFSNAQSINRISGDTALIASLMAIIMATFSGSEEEEVAGTETL